MNKQFSGCKDELKVEYNFNRIRQISQRIERSFTFQLV